MPSASDNELFVATGAPTWRPRTAESMIEAAILSDPDQLYESRLADLAGGARNARNFYRLLASGVLRYVDGSNYDDPGRKFKSLVEFTDSGLAYVTETIGDRVAKLVVVKSVLDGGEVPKAVDE